MFQRGDRRERLSQFYARHGACPALRVYVWSGAGQVSIRAKCKPSCDARTVLTVSDHDMPVWLLDERGTVLGRAGELYRHLPEGLPRVVVIGGTTAAEARTLWAQGDICIVAPLEWL